MDHGNAGHFQSQQNAKVCQWSHSNHQSHHQTTHLMTQISLRTEHDKLDTGLICGTFKKNIYIFWPHLDWKVMKYPDAHQAKQEVKTSQLDLWWWSCCLVLSSAGLTSAVCLDLHVSSDLANSTVFLSKIATPFFFYTLSLSQWVCPV